MRNHQIPVQVGKKLGSPELPARELIDDHRSTERDEGIVCPPSKDGEEDEVPTCTNGVTTRALSQPETRRNCNVSKDAHFPRQDGKTPGPLLQLDIEAFYVMCRIGGSL